MINIGIESDKGLVYEGSGNYGRAVWPTPVITSAKIVFESEGSLTAEASSNPLGCRFREDFYDPVSRIRRGRFYFSEGSLSIDWYLQPHPGMTVEAKSQLPTRLDTFYGRTIWHQYMKWRKEQPLVLLGVDDRFTVWTIINVEAISTGEDLVTMKARSSFGSLPNVKDEEIPESFRAAVSDSLDTLADEIHRSAPVSIIDRARDAASQILLAYFGTEVKELAELAQKLENEKQMVVAASAAKIIARLHARAKPVEKQKREMRAIREQDAELAVQCVGTILCELGWADWA